MFLHGPLYHIFSFFRYEFDTDHTVYQLNILHALTQEPLGVINWFAVHPTSMNNTNHLISGDNKGLASQLLERHVNQGNDVSIFAKIFSWFLLSRNFFIFLNKGPFVAAFASSNLGDVSPNLKGPKCLDTGLECDLYHSTCEGWGLYRQLYHISQKGMKILPDF